MKKGYLAGLSLSVLRNPFIWDSVERKDEIWFKTQGKCRYQLNLYSAFVITTEKHVGMFPCNEKEQKKDTNYRRF